MFGTDGRSLAASLGAGGCSTLGPPSAPWQDSHSSSLVLPASVAWPGTAGCRRARLSEARTARVGDATWALGCAPNVDIGPSDYRGRFGRLSRGGCARPALGASRAARALPAHEAADGAPHQLRPRRTPAAPVRAGRGARGPAPGVSVAASAVVLGRRASVTAAPRLRGRRTRSPGARVAVRPARSLRGRARSPMLTGAPVRAGDGLVPSAACRRARRTWRAAFGDARAHATSGARVS